MTLGACVLVALVTALIFGGGIAFGYWWGYERGESDEWWRHHPASDKGPGVPSAW